MPFGLQREAWDQAAPKPSDITQWLNKLAASTGSESFHFIFVHKFDLFDAYQNACAQAHLSTVQPWFWHKPNTNIENKSTINAVEVIGVAEFRSDGKYGQQRWPTKDAVFDNPLNRHNFLEFDGVTTRLKNRRGQVVNQHEKPPELFWQMHRRFGRANSSVLIIGAGAGGDVLGAIPGSQTTIIALEPDAVQFGHLTRRICKLASPSPHCKDTAWLDGRVNFDVEQDFKEIELSCLACGGAFQSDEKAGFCVECGTEFHADQGDRTETCFEIDEKFDGLFFCNAQCIAARKSKTSL